MSRTRFHSQLELLALFLVGVVLTLIIVIITNQQQHSNFKSTQYQACIQSRTIARNQRRVITALLTLEGDEPNAGKEHIKDIALLQVALARVPKFDCRR